MNRLWLLLVLGFWLVFTVVGCTTRQIIEKSEYQPSIAALKTDNPSMALKKFPKKEKTHFIPLLEKVYLQLIDDLDVISKDSKDSPEFTALLAQSRDIERNEAISVSNELNQLLFIQTDEGYYPANHEIFWMHLLLGLTFVKKGQNEKARVEAKKISELYARVDMKGRPFYDNAGLRVLSASLWSLCGEKENALVDLRKAAEFGDYPAIKNYENKPLNWELTFKGTGADAGTDMDSFAKKLSGFKTIDFKPSVPENKSSMDVKAKASPLIFPTRKWHEDNLNRNEAFKETIQKSKYMSRMFMSEFEYQSLNLLTTTATGMVLATGIAVGVAIVGGGIYLAAQPGVSGGGDAIVYIIGAGFMIGTEIYNAGMSFYTSAQDKIQTERKEIQDVSRFYRYVRFIPDYFILDTELAAKKQTPFLQQDNASGKIRLYFEP